VNVCFWCYCWLLCTFIRLQSKIMLMFVASGSGQLYTCDYSVMWCKVRMLSFGHTTRNVRPSLIPVSRRDSPRTHIWHWMPAVTFPALFKRSRSLAGSLIVWVPTPHKIRHLRDALAGTHFYCLVTSALVSKTLPMVVERLTAEPSTSWCAVLTTLLLQQIA